MTYVAVSQLKASVSEYLSRVKSAWITVCEGLPVRKVLFSNRLGWNNCGDC